MSRRVLIAHDDPQSVAMLAAMLAPLRHDVVSVARAEDALAHLDGSCPDLVIVAPEMAGFEDDPCGRDVLAQLREREHAYVPVIALVGRADREHWVEALEAGADAVIDAPFDRVLLHATVRSLLARKDRHDAIRARHDALVEEQRRRHAAMRGLVHDLRSPLMIAQAGIAYASSNAGWGEETSSALSEAADGIEHTAKLVTQLLATAGVEPSAHLATDPFTRSASERAPAPRPLRRPTSERAPIGARVLRVLVVDEIDASRRALRDLLDDTHHVTMVASAREALSRLETDACDVVLVDVDMPEMDGLAATRAIHARAETRHLPVIAISGHGLVGDLERARSAGCVSFVAKPVGRTELSLAIATAVDRARASARTGERA